MNPFPIDNVRARFPSLSRVDDERRRIYLDNPAGTQVPQSVADAIRNHLLCDNANLGGAFPTTQRSTEVWQQAHVDMAHFLGAESHTEIVIGPNMTTLTYHLSRTIGRDWGPDDEIICTRMDHEGNVGPWMQLAADRGVRFRLIPFSTDSWQVEPETLKAALSERTRLVALTYASNLSGSINDVRELTRIAKQYGALVYVDAVQFAPHAEISVDEIGCDFLACSAYKFFGPHLGVVWGKGDVLDSLVPYKLRCSSAELPGRLETGTPQIELLAGLSATVDYFVELGEECGVTGSRRDRIGGAFEAIRTHETELARQLIESLVAMDGVNIRGISRSNRLDARVPTVSFTVEDRSSRALVRRLNEEGIFCWSGHNYAWEMVHQLDIDPLDGVVRIGIAHYNTEGEIRDTIESIGRNITRS